MAEELTRENVLDEMHRIHNDPAHPHHEGFKRGLPQSVAYVDSLYRRIPGGEAKVELGEGIDVTGDPAKATGQDASADSAWLQEAKRDLGDAWEWEARKVQDVGARIFAGDEEAEVAFIDKMLAAGMTERQIFDMARKLEK